MVKLEKGSQEAKDHMEHLRSLKGGSLKSGYVKKMIATNKFDINRMFVKPSENLLKTFSRKDISPSEANFVSRRIAEIHELISDKKMKTKPSKSKMKELFEELSTLEAKYRREWQQPFEKRVEEIERRNML